MVNISSEAGSIGSCCLDREFDYCTTKAALNMQSTILQNYLKEKGVKILVVDPGWMRTDMGGSNANISASEAAECIYTLVESNKGNFGAPMYVDRKGKQLVW